MGGLVGLVAMNVGLRGSSLQCLSLGERERGRKRGGEREREKERERGRKRGRERSFRRPVCNDCKTKRFKSRVCDAG